jgi:hypothetical protein
VGADGEVFERHIDGHDAASPRTIASERFHIRLFVDRSVFPKEAYSLFFSSIGCRLRTVVSIYALRQIPPHSSAGLTTDCVQYRNSLSLFRQQRIAFARCS